METIDELITFEIFHIGKFSLTIGKILSALLVVLVTIVGLWLTRKALFRKKVLTKFESGNLYSFFQIIKYLVWVIASLIILETFGLKLNVILAGSAALLVGVGLGLQNTFNDFISGIILLFEGSIKVGDILEIDGDVVEMRTIGLRTSEAVNRDHIIIIIPNSLITTNKVINWSHQSKKTRFKISVGVAYGSDVDYVKNLLKQSALEHPEITDPSLVSARFVDFGNSSLDFELLFFSNSIFRIENVKSDIRTIINQKFVEHNIVVPFPQMDVYVKSTT